MTKTYSLNPADGGILAPLHVRLAWGIAVALLGISFAAGMWIYGRCYVAEITFDEYTQQICIRTLRFLGTAEECIPVASITQGRTYTGKLNTPRSFTIDAPWRSIRVDGRRLPLIVDLQGEILDQALMKQSFFKKQRSLTSSQG